MQDFYFDDWAELYASNPAEFERKRKQVLESVIQKAPLSIRNQLRLTQMECDAVREGKTPLEATVQMNRLLIENLAKLKEQLISLKSSCDDMVEQAKNLEK